MDRPVENNRFRRKHGFPVLVLLVLSLPLSASGQNVPPLERVVTISFYQEHYDVVLTKLSKEGKFTFSYSSSILDPSGTVSGTFEKKTVREILTKIFGGKIQFKEKGNYIILTRTASPPKSSVTPLVITGYVSDAETGEKIPEVSIYDRKTFSAAVSNQYGYFRLRIEKPSAENQISINKKGFLDTVVTIRNDNAEQFADFFLVPEAKAIVVEKLKESDLQSDSVSAAAEIEILEDNAPPLGPEQEVSTKERKKDSRKESRINMRNIRDTLYRDFQVSFVPFIGSNEMLSGNVINDYSLNVLGGYSLGTQEIEIGGLFNVDRGHVAKFQIAGLFNAVGGKTNGVQVAGVINMANEKVTATQLAGTLNFNLHEVHGVQAAGVININGGPSRGVQIAGVANIQIQDYQGSQIAGVLNVATHKITGTQVSGLINFGRVVKGSQIGIINVADSVHGVPVGFISLVRRGYHKLEIAADEVFYTNLAFRTGVRQFYNIFNAGIQPDDLGNPVYTFGYGVGTAPKLTRWLFLNIDLTANHVEEGHLTLKTSLLNKLYTGFDFQLSPKFSITAGATLNAYVTRRDLSEYPALFTGYEPSFVSDREIGDNSRMRMWWGAKVGVRFF